MKKLLAILLLVFSASVASAQQTQDLSWCINPEGSNFTYEELRVVMEQNFGMIELVSEYRFNPIVETDAPAGYRNDDCKVIGFQPKEWFNSPGHTAIAIHGMVFNIDKVVFLDLRTLRSIGLHVHVSSY